MNADVRTQAELVLRGFIPTLLTIVLIIVFAVPIGLPGLAPVTPLVSVGAVYYWSVYRTETMPAYAVFAIGLLEDAISGTPMGLMVLMLLLVRAVAVSQQHALARQSLWINWLGFMAIALLVSMGIWLLSSVTVGQVIPPGPGFVQFCLTIALYPCPNWLFAHTERYTRRPV